MKIYKLEFQYFDGVQWEYVKKEILANSLFQLMRTFLDETEYMIWIVNGNNVQGYEAQKELWKFFKKNIEEVKFPFVKEL